jgi:hypothetical protein
MGLIQICLQNTIGTVKMTVGSKVKNGVATAEVLFRTGTGFKKPAFVPT